jgi:hypothetical protein
MVKRSIELNSATSRTYVGYAYSRPPCDRILYFYLLLLTLTSCLYYEAGLYTTLYDETRPKHAYLIQ